MVVTIYEADRVVGTIAYDGAFSLSPPNDPTLKGVLAAPVYVQAGGELVDVFANEDPLTFMHELSSHYSGAYLRAGEVKT